MVTTQRAQNVLPRVVFFYLAPVAVLVSLAATGFAVALADEGGMAIAAAAVATAFSGAVLLRSMYVTTTGASFLPKKLSRLTKPISGAESKPEGEQGTA